MAEYRPKTYGKKQKNGGGKRRPRKNKYELLTDADSSQLKLCDEHIQFF